MTNNRPPMPVIAVRLPECQRERARALASGARLPTSPSAVLRRAIEIGLAQLEQVRP